MQFVTNRKKTAIIYGDKKYDYSDIIGGAKIYASKLNIEAQDRVIVYMENRPEFIYSFLSVWEKKGISVNLDASYSAEQLAYVIKDCEPKYIFTSAHNFEVAQEAVKSCGAKTEIINIDEINLTKVELGENEGVETLDHDTTAVILYTSGTTGEPKGVMLTFGNLMSNMEAAREIDIITEKDIILGMLPFHHVLPLTTTVLMPIHFGGLLVILKDLSSEGIRKALCDNKVTVVIGVPRIWEMIHKGLMAKINASKVGATLFNVCKNVIKSECIRKKIFKKVHEGFGGNIKILASGGAKLDADITKDFTTLGFKMVEGYGLTETSPIIAFNRPTAIKAGTVGQTIPNVEVKIAEDGEVLARGANVMKGYYKKPEETKAAIDADGWFHTGDLGTYEEGYLSITGRKKEMIVLSNGKNINPADIEIELMKRTKIIKEVAVVEHNKHLLALIYPDFDLAKKNGIVNIKEDLKWQIIDKYNMIAHPYARILETKIISHELPKTKLGKVQRFKLAPLIAEDPSAVAIKKSDYVENEVYLKIKEYLEMVHPEAQIHPEAHLEIDIGMDSLDNVEMISFIETNYGIEITEEDLVENKLVKDIAEFIRKKGGEFKESSVDWQKILNESCDESAIPVSNTLGKILNFIAFRPFFKFHLKIKKSGLDKIPNVPVIFAGNHQSMIDAFAFGQLLNKEQTKKTYYFAISEQFETPAKKWAAKHSHVIVVDMNKNIKEAIKVVAKVLRAGNNVVIFPEGARTRDGHLQEFKKAFAILSKELNVPVVVFGIKGAFEHMKFGQAIPDKGEIEISILDVVKPDKLEIPEIITTTKNTILKFTGK